MSTLTPNTGVVTGRAIDSVFLPPLSTQGRIINVRLIRSVNRRINIYQEYDAFLKRAHNPDMRFVFSDTI